MVSYLLTLLKDIVNKYKTNFEINDQLFNHLYCFNFIN